MSLGLRRPCEHGEHAGHLYETTLSTADAWCGGPPTLSDAEALRLILDERREAIDAAAAEAATNPERLPVDALYWPFVNDYGWTLDRVIDALVAAVAAAEGDRSR